ncbi:MAG: PhoH family protein [Phycisphaerae bacterium]|nr:PhoH family protein [Phycisphaerae bacterium]NUQ44605.1 PhoH family protein [Phycisphaerae bacterium]
MRKNYVLDANILLHDPHSILHFADNVVIIPVGILGEIDRFKKERTDRGYNARAVVRLLDSLRGERSLAGGIPLQNGGMLRVYCEPDRVLSGTNGHGDAELLRVAKIVQDAEPHIPVVIVTKDINLRIRADAVGLRAEDYESDRVPLANLYRGHIELQAPSAAIAELKSHGRVALPAGSFFPNEYVLLRPDDGGKSSALARVDAECKTLVALSDAPEGLWGVKPRNKEQYYAIDALLNDDIRLVTLMGKAGTGKTLLAVAAAIDKTVTRRNYRGVLVCRPIFPLGRDLGFLPGDIEQKLDPWMKPIVDTIEFLLHTGGPIKSQTDCDSLIRGGLIEIQPLTYIRGRSISNRFVVIDEAQNLTPLEVKTVITRIGEHAKIVLTGDPYQIDNPYVDADSNGFTYLVNRFKSQSLSAHVELHKGERSALAELAANLL